MLLSIQNVWKNRIRSKFKNMRRRSEQWHPDVLAQKRNRKLGEASKDVGKQGASNTQPDKSKDWVNCLDSTLLSYLLLIEKYDQDHSCLPQQRKSIPGKVQDTGIWMKSDQEASTDIYTQFHHKTGLDLHTCTIKQVTIMCADYVESQKKCVAIWSKHTWTFL